MLCSKMFTCYRLVFAEGDGRKVIIPVPIPFYIPVPMAMYSIPQPYPLPIPVPIPVPYFIPTTKKSADSILKHIKVSICHFQLDLSSYCCVVITSTWQSSHATNIHMLVGIIVSIDLLRKSKSVCQQIHLKLNF